MLELETITSVQALWEFRAQWSAFVREVPLQTAFQTPEWLITWWDHLGSGELRVMVFRHNGHIVGVVPLFLHQWNGLRQLTLLGSGLTDYTDPLLEPEHTPQIVERLAAELKRSTDWDLCNWQDLSSNTPLVSVGVSVADTQCSHIPLQLPFEDYLASLPKDLKRNLRRYREKAAAIAPVTFEVTKTADNDILSALIELHRLRWEETGQRGMIEENGAEGFLRAAASAFASRGWLRLFTLRFGSKVTAILLAFAYGDSISGYLTAFDPREQALGFGRELLLQSLRYTHEHGYRYWNFLRGDEPYKSWWGAVPIDKRRLIISR